MKYLEYRKFADADIDESEYGKAIDEIDKIEHHFKININIYMSDYVRGHGYPVIRGKLH